MSLYDYCNGDALNRFDPDGMLATPIRNFGVYLRAGAPQTQAGRRTPSTTHFTAADPK